jgi:hypothetical protein
MSVPSRARDSRDRLSAQQDVDHPSENEESGVGEMDVRVAVGGTVGPKQPQQNWPSTRPQDFGRLVFAGAAGTDFSQQVRHQLGGRLRLDANAGVRKNRAMSSADEVSAGKARLIAGNLDVPECSRHKIKNAPRSTAVLGGPTAGVRAYE